jgi:hypothetical protein
METEIKDKPTVNYKNTIYQPSGKIGYIIILGGLISLVCFPLLGAIYAFLSSFFMNILIEIILFIIYLGVLSYLIFFTIKISKCRNHSVSTFFGGVVGLITAYSALFFFTYFNAQNYKIPIHYLDLLSQPNKLLELAKIFSFSSNNFYILLIFENLLILIVAFFGGRYSIHEKVFCENCKKWTKESKFKLRFKYYTIEHLNEILSTDITKILELPQKKDTLDNFNHILLNIQECKSCLNSSTLNVDLITYKQDKKGVKEEIKDFSPVLMLSQNEFSKFKELGEKMLEIEKKENELRKIETENDQLTDDSDWTKYYNSNFDRIIRHKYVYATISILHSLLILAIIIDLLLPSGMKFNSYSAYEIIYLIIGHIIFLVISYAGFLGSKSKKQLLDLKNTEYIGFSSIIILIFSIGLISFGISTFFSAF